MIMRRLADAMNAHDLDELIDCFAQDYRSEQPAHPNRSFAGSEQVRENWGSVFAGVPDLTAEILVAATSNDGVEMGEWFWHGTYLDDSVFAMRGVIVVGVDLAGRIAWGRLYMEPVEHASGDINDTVRETYRPPA